MFVFANVLQPLIDVFEALLKLIHSGIGSWGWSIIAMTVVIRAALVPLTLKQMRGMRRMQALAPEIKKLQEKYKEDKPRLNQEMMRFYQENQVNPLSSCLPLVAQFPVFISLFYMLRTDLKHDICPSVTKSALAEGTKLANVHCGDQGGFLFIPDLTNKATGAVLILLIALYVGSQIVSTLLMSMTADKTQRRIFLILPLVFVTFIIRFPAGLLVYWITTNMWTIAQGFIVRRQAPPVIAPAGATAGGGGGSGGFFSNLLSNAAKAGAKPNSAGGNGTSTGADATNGKARARPEKPENGDGQPKAKPPPPPRKKRKQRSGRRR